MLQREVSVWIGSGGTASKENSEFDTMHLRLFPCNFACLGMELTAIPSQCVSLSQCPQVPFGEVWLSHDSTWLLTMSTAAGVSGLTWAFYYYLAATGRAGILTIRQGLCPARPCRRYATDVVCVWCGCVHLCGVCVCVCMWCVHVCSVVWTCASVWCGHVRLCGVHMCVCVYVQKRASVTCTTCTFQSGSNGIADLLTPCLCLLRAVLLLIQSLHKNLVNELLDVLRTKPVVVEHI